MMQHDRHYAECIAVWRSGRTQVGRCRADRLLDADRARQALQDGLDVVYVAREDAAQVLARGTGGEATA